MWDRRFGDAANALGLGDLALLDDLAHSATTGQTTDDHHDKSHAHDGADGSGTVAHSDTTGQTTDDHHPQVHTHPMTKVAAASISAVTGTPTGTVADLQSQGDGTFYHLVEVAGVPGMAVTVNFTGITALLYMQALIGYNGSSTHAVAHQLYDWANTRWTTFGCSQNQYVDVATAGGYIICNAGFWVPEPANFIGTGGDAGKVDFRAYHTNTGVPSHTLDIDVVALYY